MVRNKFPQLLDLRERAVVVNNILKRRLDTLLPMAMRETGFDMWIIICHEDNYDPVFKTLMPWECWAPILQIIVFYDRGEGEGIERLNISRTYTHGFMNDIWDPNGSEDQWECLKRIVRERNPSRIGINQSKVIWAADGLTSSLKEKLISTLGEELSQRLESAEQLCIRWLETRLDEEIQLYHHVCAIAHAIIRECFSRRSITPGVTTCEDLRWRYWQIANELGLSVSFPPFFRIVRNIKEGHNNDPRIQMGDMIHCDVGIEYLRLLSDHQELAYVLRPDEDDAPDGLKQGLREANKLQDIFISEWKEGLTGNEILRNALNKAREHGISKPKIYSHSIGHFLHEPGPLMGLPWEQESCPGRGDVKMNYNTCFTVELSVTRPVAEWNGQEVSFSIEQDAVFTKDGPIFLDGRQTEFHLI